MTIRQFLMLRVFHKNTHDIEQALRLNQRTFGSLCAREWIRFDAHARVFYLDEAGEAAYQMYTHWDRFRRTDNGKFSVFVPPTRSMRRSA